MIQTSFGHCAYISAKIKIMKQVIFLLALLICSSSYTQTLNGIPVEELDVKYIQIVGQSKLLKVFEVTIYVNYGQIGSIKDSQKGKGLMLTKDGKQMTFNGMMDAVNFFSNYGYELEFAYPISIPNSGRVYHYIMYKKDAQNTNANDVLNNKGNTSKDDMKCKCNALIKEGQTSKECQAFFQTLNISTPEGKAKYKADLKRLGCE